MLMTLRSHDQFNTTIYGLHDRYRGVNNGRRVIFMNVDDIAERELEDQAWVDITSHFEGQVRRAARFMIVKYAIPRGCAAAYYPEANVLVPLSSVVARSNTPSYKSIVVTVTRSTEEFAVAAEGVRATSLDEAARQKNGGEIHQSYGSVARSRTSRHRLRALQGDGR